MEIHDKEGMSFIHQQQLGRDPDEPEVADLDPIDFKKKSIYVMERLLTEEYPWISKAVYMNTLDGRLMISPSLLGFFGEDVPLTSKDAPIITKICKQIESKVHTVTTKKGVLNLHYETDQQRIFAVLKELATDNERNIFIETIERTHWDGKKRIRHFLKSVGCSAPGLPQREEEDYLETVFEGFLLSVLERNLVEDYSSIQFVLVMVGGQGVGKSTICERLALTKFHGSCAVSVHEQRRFYECCQGAVIVELKEGTQFNNDSDAELKATIDSTKVQFRKAYAAEPSAQIVHYSFIVTTNDENFLSDQSGNRRYFPVTVNLVARGADNHPIIFDVPEEEFLQIWAEALVLFGQGLRWHSKINTDRMKYIIQCMQNSITLSTQESDDIYTYVDTFYPNVGDEFTTKDMTMYFKTLDRDDRDIRAIKQQFGKNSARYGFEYKGEENVWNGVVRSKTKRYVRVSPIPDYKRE